ncbi:10687_t:CDS:2, partial [Gigaspora rosea]
MINCRYKNSSQSMALLFCQFYTTNVTSPLEPCANVTSPSESETSNDRPQKSRQGGPIFNKVWNYVIRDEK